MDRKILELLACPNCAHRPKLDFDESKSELLCGDCERRYPVKDGIPVLLREENHAR